MGISLHFLSKIIVLQFKSIDWCKCFFVCLCFVFCYFIIMEALLYSSLSLQRPGQEEVLPPPGDQLHSSHRPPPVMRPPYVLWLPSLGKQGGEEERLAERGRPPVEGPGRE